MKLALKTILFLFPIIAMSQSFYKLTHYNVLNSNLKTKYLGDNNFILYGQFGGVLRSTDGGESWDQKFSGTHENISKVIQYNNELYGITYAGELMKSSDGGNHWSITKISNALLTDISVNEGLIFISQVTDSIMVSSDGGNSWNSEFITQDTLNSIFFKNNEIIVNGFRNKLLKKEATEWVKLDLPELFSTGLQYSIKTTENELYIFGLGDIFKLNNDLSWQIFKTGDIYFNDFIETDNQIITLQSNLSNERIDLKYYQKSDMSVINTESIIDSNLTNYNFQSTGIDISDNGDIIVTAIGKTIFIKKNNSDWETKSSYEYIYGLAYGEFIDEKKWNFFSDPVGNFQWTRNAGTTFEQGARVFRGLTNNIISRDYITNDSINVTIKWQDDFDIAISSDAGKTFDFQKLDIPYTNLNIYKKEDNYTIYSKSAYKNQSTKQPFIEFYKEENGVLDTLFELDSVYKTMNYENKILLIQDMNSNQEFEFYLTGENYKNPELVHTFKYEYNENESNAPYIKSINIDKNNNIFLFFSRWPNEVPSTYTSIYKIIEFGKPTELMMEENTIFFSFPDNYQIGQKDKYVRVGIAPDIETRADYFFATIDLTNGFDYTIVGESEVDFMQPQYTDEDGILLFERRTQNLWRPIEPDRIPTSVSVEATPPPIWTYPPYPNPTRDKISVAFYSGTMSDVNELEISIINIATGVITKVEPTNLNILNNWNGKIDIDVSSYNSGQYMIEFKLKDKKSVEKFIINR
jgi:hypothetical protein